MSESMLYEVKQAILEYKIDEIEGLIKNALAQGLNPSEIMDVLVQAMREIGDGYEKGILFLPDMIGAADAMQNALPVLKAAFRTSGQARESLGVALIGTVAGDIHTIGKSMVVAMMIAEGFDVYDLGVDIPTEKFLEAVRTYNPAILGMSALLSTTAPEVIKVIEALKREGLRDTVKILVGGGAVTESFAKEIGADGYDDTAPGAAVVARHLISR